MSGSWDPVLYAGLKAIASTTFPKTCRNCGRVFPDEAAYIAETQPVSAKKSGLKQAIDDDGPIVELFRNCPCGSTLMDVFSDRRDGSDAGRFRRQRFGELLAYLVAHEVPPDLARNELLTVMRGGKSERLRRFRPPAKT